MIAFFARFRSRRSRDQELDDEIRAHLEMAVRERIARGESPEEAVRAARREFGDPTRVKEVTRAMWGGMWLERLVADVRYAVRGLKRAPGFTIMAVLTFALGVGANTAMFTVVRGVLLRPLPFGEPDRLYLVSHDDPNPPLERPETMWASTFTEMRRTTRAFEGVTSIGREARTLTGTGEPTRLRAALVTAGFNEVMGVQPAIGRGFVPEEETPGRHQVAMLGDALWRSRFAGDPSIVGRTITLNGASHTVVGVMPSGFDFPYDAEVWVPMTDPGPGLTYSRPTIGRLAADATLVEAIAETERIGEATIPSFVREPETRVILLLDFIAGGVERSLAIFAGAVGFVLLIACANVANLFLVRAAGRQREVVVRAALGAPKARIARQLLTESMLVALLGGAVGVVASIWAVTGILAFAPDGLIPRVGEVRVDGMVLAVSLATTVLAGLAFGLAPVLSLTKGLWGGLGDGTRTLGGGQARLRRTLVVAEIALSIVLLIGAGLLMRSFSRIRSVELGFRPEQSLALSVDLPEAYYPDASTLRVFNTAMLTQLSAIPGAEATGSVNWAPLTSSFLMGSFHVEGVAEMPANSFLDKMAATPDYFRAAGIDVVFGRAFTAEDDVDAVPAAIISRSVAERFWPPDGSGAIGQRITGRDRPQAGDWLTIVGVVEDVVQMDLTEGRRSAMYTPVQQSQSRVFLGAMTFVVRSSGAPEQSLPAMRAALTRVDPKLAVTALRPMGELVSDSISRPRFEAGLLAAFSFLALLLAAVGTYGVLAYDVASRTTEIGLRMALGAAADEVVRSVIMRAAALAAAGVAIGLLASVGLTRILSDTLYEITPTDPATFALVPATLFVVAILAAVVPARRAVSVDPLKSLRQEV